jgi:hypothetical protein
VLAEAQTFGSVAETMQVEGDDQSKGNPSLSRLEIRLEDNNLTPESNAYICQEV